MKKTLLGAMVLCVVLGMTGCASTTPTPTAQPTTMAPTQTPTPEPTPVPATPEPTQAPTPSPEATTGTGAAAMGEIRDGMYRAEMSETITQEEKGWQGYLELTIEDGKLKDAEFDYIKDGKKKSEATAAEYPMTPAPGEWIPEYRAEVLKAGLSGDAIDAITGATESGRDVNALYQAALEAAREGNTETVTVESVEQGGAS